MKIIQNKFYIMVLHEKVFGLDLHVRTSDSCIKDHLTILPFHSYFPNLPSHPETTVYTI